jgi:hypothetical protein
VSSAHPEIAEETVSHHLEPTENSYCDNYTDSNGGEVSLVEKLLEGT